MDCDALGVSIFPETEDVIGIREAEPHDIVVCECTERGFGRMRPPTRGDREEERNHRRDSGYAGRGSGKILAFFFGEEMRRVIG